MNLGENIVCPHCNTESLPPYYSCKTDCPLTISRKEWENIRQVFENTPIACHETRTVKCQGHLHSPNTFKKHLLEDHKIKKMFSRPSSNPKDLGVVYISAPADKIGSVEYFRWPAIYFEADGKTFIFNIVYERGRVYWWVIGDFAETKPKQYMLQSNLQVKGHEANPEMDEYTRSPIQKSPIRCLQLYNFEQVKKVGHTVSMDGSLLLGSFCKPNPDKKYKNVFVIKIRISKNCKKSK